MVTTCSGGKLTFVSRQPSASTAQINDIAPDQLSADLREVLAKMGAKPETLKPETLMHAMALTQGEDVSSLKALLTNAGNKASQLPRASANSPTQPVGGVAQSYGVDASTAQSEEAAPPTTNTRPGF